MDNKQLPVLCNSYNCMGCSSCAQSCPKDAIEMNLNSEGFYNPFVNSDKCIGCHKCEKSCPILNPNKKNEGTPKAYATWNKDSNIRHDSSSGGVFTSFAEVILRQGGAVWGAGFDDRMVLTYQCIESENSLSNIRRSKYIQAHVGDTFKQIQNQLISGRKVLFCGTPCHVAGLYSFLIGENLDNLLTLDFICHGVPSSQLFLNYNHWLEDKYKDRIIDFNFREKRFGTNYNVGTSATFLHQGKRFLYLEDNSYTLGFCRDLTIHGTCSQCHFRNLFRPSDITMGDFHSLMKMFSSNEQFKGISCLIVNSKRGEGILKSLNLDLKEVPLENIIKTNPGYTKNRVSKSIDLKNIVESPYEQIQFKYFKPNIDDMVKTMIMRILGGRLTYLLRNFK